MDLSEHATRNREVWNKDAPNWVESADGDADEVRYFMKRGWAQRWPCEEVWVVRRTG